jgi:hypothetical protein
MAMQYYHCNLCKQYYCRDIPNFFHSFPITREKLVAHILKSGQQPTEGVCDVCEDACNRGVVKGRHKMITVPTEHC